MSNAANPSRQARLASSIRRYRRPLVVGVQLVLVVVSFLASFILADGLSTGLSGTLVIQALAILLPLRLGSMLYFRLFHGLWRYVGTQDLLQITKAATASSLVFVPVAAVLFGFDTFLTRVLFLDWAGNIFLLGGIRLAARALRERIRPAGPVAAQARRLLIVGAGDAGAMLCSQALTSPELRFIPVAFVDDDSRKAGTAILGIPIAGTSSDIPRIVAERRVDTIVIAIPSAAPEEMRALVELCQRSGVPFKTLPAMPDMLEQSVYIRRIREVDLADLLGRPQAKLDHTGIQHLVQGARVLVTGAAGSVGSELARQIALLEPELLVLVDRAENPLRLLQTELAATGAGSGPSHAEIVDVTDEQAVGRLMDRYRPQLVFHAAAYKHVTFMERAPAGAVTNNIGGTHVVARAAQAANVSKFVLVSTDKAVNPTSVMGVTKRVAELMMSEMNRQGPTRFIAVRFGNVLGSAGSVVPVFKEQIARGGPVTVTHRDARRYFMSLSEAAALIMQAAAVGSGGECFVLEMGEPVKIVDIAETLISLSGLRPHEDIQIVFTGLQDGEKLSEELHSSGETLEPIAGTKLRTVRLSNGPKEVIREALDLCHQVASLAPDEIKAQLRVLVPEYEPAPAAPPAGTLPHGTAPP